MQKWKCWPGICLPNALVENCCQKLVYIHVVIFFCKYVLKIQEKIAHKIFSEFYIIGVCSTGMFVKKIN